MLARRMRFTIVIVAVLGLLLSACAPAATPAPTATKAPPTVAKPVEPTPAPKPGLLTPTPTAVAPKVATPAPTTPAAQIKRGGILKVVNYMEPDFGDFHRNSAVTALPCFSDIHRGVIQVSQEDRKNIVPDIATKWEISEGGKVFTFTIREGIKDSQGQPFTAADCAYNINRALLMPNKIPMPRTGVLRGMVEKAEAPNPTTLKVTLLSPAAAFIPAMAMPYMLMQPKRILEPIDAPGKGEDLTAEQIVGVGPFKLKRWRRGAVWEAEPNPYYWEKGKPYLDGVQVFLIPDPTTRTAALRTGAVHMGPPFRTPSKKDIEDFKQFLGDKIQTAKLASPGMAGVRFNLQKPPFNDRDIRWAVHLAIDRDLHNRVVYEADGKLASPYFIAWDWLIPESEYLKRPGFRQDKKDEDIAEARKIMEKKGYTTDNPLKAVITTVGVAGDQRLKDSLVLRDALKKIHLDLQLRQMESAAMFDSVTKGDFQCWMESTGTEFDDPEAYHGTLYLPTAGRNVGRWENAEWLKLYEQQRSEYDQAKRAEILRQMEKIMWEDMPVAGIIRLTATHVWWSFVKGYVPPTFHQADYRHDNLWLDL